jgi:hypothetical protein
MRALTLILSFAVSASALAATIPADLEARAAELRKQASPQMLAWAHDQGMALARANGPIDLGALQQGIRSQFVRKRAPVARQAADPEALIKQNEGVTPPGGDIAAMCFIVMMEATNDIDKDLKMIPGGTKRSTQRKEPRMASFSNVGPTPTPPPDRLAQLVVAAQSLVHKTHGANLAALAHR